MTVLTSPRGSSLRVKVFPLWRVSGPISQVYTLSRVSNRMEQHIFNRFVYSQKQMLSYMRDSPQKRYEEILIDRPDIIMRVPQHYIASYLGITKVHLSRIKAKIAKKG